MSTFKIISVVGARPQFIKLAALHKAIQASNRLQHIIVHSGQHYDDSMSGQFFNELSIPNPNYNLEIGSGSQNVQMAKCILGMDSVLNEEKPDLVIVYGDTNTTSAAAIATAKNNISLAHVEAGLREFDKSIPEEVNKLITDAISDLYFTPTQTGIINLQKQGVYKNVYKTGDISLDLLYNMPPISEIKISVGSFTNYVFATCHRVANTENAQNLESILRAFVRLDRQVVFAMHPRTKNAINQHGLDHYLTDTNISVIDPPGFYQTQEYIRNAAFVVTDSGGVIKETYFHKVPGIIIDKQTEWVETVQEGWNTVTGPHTDLIITAIKNWKKPIYHSNCLGDGTAGQRIVDHIIQYLDAKKE